MKALSGSALKVIAVISMTIDHVALYVMAENLGQRLQLYYLVKKSTFLLTKSYNYHYIPLKNVYICTIISMKKILLS